MKEDLRHAITDERLVTYRKRMKEKFATPVLCIGVGHAHMRGEMVACIPPEIPLTEIRDLVAGALAGIDDEIAKAKAVA